MRRSKRKKEHIDWAEFRGNYIPVPVGDLMTIIDAYKHRELGRDELRAFAGGLEAKALHEKSHVDIYRIVNAKSKNKGIRRLTAPQIDAATNKVAKLLSRSSDTPNVLVENGDKQVLVARRFARHIAQGRCTCSEMIMLFYYCVRRLRQHKPLDRLLPRQRYARFTYRSLEALSGIPRANLCRALARLKERGFIATRPVAKQNENHHGLLFVDGHLVTLTLGQRTGLPAKVDKTTTPDRQNNNTSSRKTTTLINVDPKKTIQEQNAPPPGRITWNTNNRGVQQIVARVNAMLEAQLEQAA